MIRADLFFIFFMILFGFFGASRGWVREVLASFAMIFSLFLYSQPDFVRLLQPLLQQEDKLLRFVFQSSAFLLLTFFGYLGPAVAQQRLWDRSNVARRLEGSLLAFILGAFNGYLLLSTLLLWALNTELIRSLPEIFQPPPEGWEKFFFVQNAAPIIFSGSLLLFFLAGIVVFIIVALV